MSLFFNIRNNINFSSRASGAVIPEENLEEYRTGSDGNHNTVGSNSSLSLSMHLSGAQTSLNEINERRGSPAPSYSPYGISPAGGQTNNSGYMIMSPCIDCNRG